MTNKPVIINAISIAVGEIIPASPDENDIDDNHHTVVVHRAACQHEERMNGKKEEDGDDYVHVVTPIEEKNGQKKSGSHHFGFFHHHHHHHRHNEDHHHHHHLHIPFHHPASMPEMKLKAIQGELIEEELHLSTTFPTATKEEVRRFLIARDGNVDEAEEKLRDYFQWRQLHGLDNAYDCDCDENDDEADWNRAAQLALSSFETPSSSSADDAIHNGASANHDNSSQTKTHAHNKTRATTLPRLVHLYYHTQSTKQNPTTTTTTKTITDLQNTKTLQVTPARLNLSLATPSTYANAVAFYLHYKLTTNTSSSSMEKMTVLIDLRGHAGWSNPTPKHCLPFIKIVTKLLGDYYPERLKRCIMFPLPKAATVIWNLVKRLFLEKNMVKKIVVIGCDHGSGGGVPKQLEDYFDGETIQGLERNRDV